MFWILLKESLEIEVKNQNTKWGECLERKDIIQIAFSSLEKKRNEQNNSILDLKILHYLF